jgi:hypothetical protein
MSVTATSLLLLLYPLLHVLPLNVVRFYCGFGQGLTPMPPEVRAKAQVTDRTVQFLIYLTLLTVAVFLLRSSAIPPEVAGLNTRGWKESLALGTLISFLSWVLAATVQIERSADESLNTRLSGNLLSIRYGLAVVGSVAVEFWRALCIAALIRLDCPPWIAVLIAAVPYGAPQLLASAATAAGAATSGVVLGFLFVTTGSLVAPLTVSITTDAFLVFLSSRHARSLSVMCPICGSTFDAREAKGKGRPLDCPRCGERLEREPPGRLFLLLLYIGCICTLPVVSYSVGHWTFASILISFVVGFLLYLAGIFAYFAVMPLKLRQRLSHGESGLRLTEKVQGKDNRTS